MRMEEESIIHLRLKPNATWRLVNSNVSFGIFGKPPNKFQRWMLKQLLGIHVEDEE